jgi:hypothetical protein
MTLADLIDRIKVVPKHQAEDQVKRFMLELIGQDKPGKLLENRYKRKLRRIVTNL